MLRGVNKIAVLDLVNRQVESLRFHDLAYSGQERYRYRFYGAKGGLMNQVEVLRRQAYVAAMCGEFLVSALEEAVLEGIEETSIVPEIVQAEKSYAEELDDNVLALRTA